ncbi:MAG: hypothetical protein PHR16_02415 [Methylovulum sp.]|nr:hypothetical protein [Methylovulum sp.]
MTENLPDLFDEAEILELWDKPLTEIETILKTKGDDPLPDWLAVEMMWLRIQLERKIQDTQTPQEKSEAIKSYVGRLKNVACWPQINDFDKNFPLLDCHYLHEQGIDLEVNSLSCFLAHPQSKAISPHRLFNTVRYKDFEQIRQMPHHPLVHFFRHSSGYRAKSPTPNAYFDCDWYRKKYLQNQPFKNPLLHYLAHFPEVNIQPSEHFYNDYVRRTEKLSDAVDPLAYYLEQLESQGVDFCRDGFSPCPYFDRAYYLATYPDIKEATEAGGFDPFWHFSAHGLRREGRRAHPWLLHNMCSPEDILAFQAKKKSAVLILGMHRSGTSALTRAVNLLGMALPSHLMEANSANETGYWESTELSRIHDEILISLGSCWDDILPIDDERLQLASTEYNKSVLTDYIVREFSHANDFVLKDPRMCRLVPLWLNVLDDLNVDVKIVIPFRNPLEVAESLKKRDGTLLERSFLLWLQHILEAERHTRDLPRCFVGYTQLLNNYQLVLGQIAQQCRLQWPDSSEDILVAIAQFIDNSHYHQRVTQEECIEARVPDWVFQIFLVLNALTQNGHEPQSIEKLDKITEYIDQASRLYAPIIADKDRAFDTMLENYRHKQAKIRQHLQDIQQLVED